MKQLTIILALLISLTGNAQNGYWQQRADYKMNIDLDVNTHRFTGKQTITYTNNSPDTLQKLFYHLYFNAFQPGSMMDVRSRTISDPDPRVGSRIEKLSPEEMGYHKVKSLKAGNNPVKFHVENTILEARLKKPILPGQIIDLTMEFESQVPLQIRRSGRDSKEGIAYSMSQWYPKLSEYDADGWHPNPYIGREFYGIWGNWDVTLTLDESYIVGATGTLEKESVANGKKTWNFKAKNVHDFVWAADPDYLHDVVDGPNGMKIHFYYQDNEKFNDNWKNVQQRTVETFEILNKYFGKYPYPKYSVIQGGDGGMEYPMATLITGERSPGSLLGVIVHEVAHSWFQMMLATDEAQYAWMDEGFTSFASSIVMNEFAPEPSDNPHTRSMRGYVSLARSGKQEPLTTHADHYISNRTYGTSSYSKGQVFLWQLQNIVGEKTFFKGMLEYHKRWAFKHPDPRKFIKVMEDASGMVLDWYLENWIGTTNTIDYGIHAVTGGKNKTSVVLERVGDMPMPLEVLVTMEDGKKELFYIPLTLMRGTKMYFFHTHNNSTSISDWPWTHPFYSFDIPVKFEKIASIEIDPGQIIADINRKNNRFPQQDGVIYYAK